MNEIQLARLANMAKKSGAVSPTSPTRTPPISPTMDKNDNTGSLPNSNSEYIEETSPPAGSPMGPPAEPERRTRKPPPLGSDLRERSLAMYKSINNMMAVGKSELASMRRIPLPGARAVALDFAYHELYGTGALTIDDYNIIRKTVDELTSKEHLVKLIMTQEQVR